jgi:hypothetical protein
LTRDDDTDRDPDIVLVILQLVKQAAPTFPEEKVREIVQQVREQYGGRRLHIHKRSRHLTAAEREQVVQAAMAGVPDAEILTKHRISLRTLDRAVKGGGRRFG